MLACILQTFAGKSFPSNDNCLFLNRKSSLPASVLVIYYSYHKNVTACYGNCDTAINAIEPFQKLLFHCEVFSVDLLEQRCAI